MDNTQNIAAAWRAGSGPLAAYAWRHLVNRTDVWGAYLPVTRRSLRRRADGSTHVLTSVTAPPVRNRGMRTLTPGVLTRHFGGHDVGFLIGLHTTSIENTSRWGLVEVDRHGEGGDPHANWVAVLHYYRLLRRLGFRPWLSDSNGRGGYHLRVVFDAPVPTEKLYRFLRRLVRDHKRLGLAERPEYFPKQPIVAAGKCGNWVRLPGRHHSREHWTQFWDGMRWLGGSKAVEFVLGSRPDPAHLLPDIPPEQADGVLATNHPTPPVAPTVDVTTSAVSYTRMTPTEVAIRCLAHIPNYDVHYDDWIAVGMALHSADSSGTMLAAWDRWSAGSNKHTPGECSRCWAAFSTVGREKQYTVGTLVHLARRHGHEPFPSPRKNAVRVAPHVVRASLPVPPACDAFSSSYFTISYAGRGVR